MRHLHLGAPFSPDWELKGRHFFRSESASEAAEFRGGLCILGSRFFKSRGGLDGAVGFRGRHLFTLQSSRGGIFSKGCHFSEEVSSCGA